MNLFKTAIFLFLTFVFQGFGFAAQTEEADSLALLLKMTKVQDDKVDIYLAIANEFKNNNPNKALTFAQKAYVLSVETDYETGKINSMLQLAQINWAMTDFKTAMEFVEKAIEMSDKDDRKKELAVSLQTKGLIYIELSDYEKSTDCFFNSLKLFESLDDKSGVLRVLSYIGSVNFYQKNFKKALDYYFRSLDLANETGDQEGIARAFNNIAAVYEAMEEYEKAGKYFQQASEINKQLHNLRGEGINYMNLGAITFNLDDYPKSLDYLEKALEIFVSLKSKILQARCYVNLAEYHRAMEETETSMEYAKKALVIGTGQDLKQIVHDAAEIIQKIYLHKGDKEKAYDFAVLQHKMKDSLVLMENQTELAKQELQYEFDKREQVKRIEQQRKDLIILIVVISLLLALMVVILIFARQRVKAKSTLIEKQQLEYKLEFRNKELTSNVLSLMKKNELLSVISDKLISIKNEAVKKETRDAISKISREIENITNEEILEEFELRFKQVHSVFYDKLIKQFPNLSPSEQRLCAFLRLNMTTKEISELTGQQPGSLETARYRLRKKLGISNSQTNLVSFLSRI